MKGKIKARDTLRKLGRMDNIAAEYTRRTWAQAIMELYAQSFRIYFASLLASHMLTRLEKEKK